MCRDKCADDSVPLDDIFFLNKDDNVRFLNLLQRYVLLFSF